MPEEEVPSLSLEEDRAVWVSTLREAALRGAEDGEA